MFSNLRVLTLSTTCLVLSAALASAQRSGLAIPGPGGALNAPCTGFGFGATVLPGATGDVISTSLPHITRVADASPAAAAGFQVGDTIVAFAGRAGNTRGALKLPEPGTTVDVKIKRGVVDTTLKLTVGKMADAGESGLAYDPQASTAGGAPGRRICAVVAPTEHKS
jgi:membrane-associated protease RseP (regulator of RpoE activity)